MALTAEKVMGYYGSMVSVGPGPPVALGVPGTRWIPATCEAPLDWTLVLAPPTSSPFPGMMDVDGSSRPANWAACQQRAMEIFVAEYLADPDVQLLNKLSKTIDSLDISTPEALQRLHRARLLLLSPRYVPKIVDVIAMLQGAPLPPVTLESPGGGEIYPFRVVGDPSAPAAFEARGTINAGSVVMRFTGTLHLREPAVPAKIEPCLCFQPVTGDIFLRSLSITPNLTFASVENGEIHLGQQEFMYPFSPVVVNLRRFWACFRVTSGANKEFFFHADDAAKKGCKLCG
jgi:hypothetical protein